MPEVQIDAVTRSQARCLAALRAGKSSAVEIAAEAKVGRFAVVHALRALEAAGLAERSAPDLWRPTAAAEARRLALTTRARPGQREQDPSPNGRRLLEMLAAPVEGRTIAKRLGVSRQGALNIIHRLHAQGHLKFGDPNDPSWIVMRATDDTPVLTRDETRVLSAMPAAYATDSAQLRRRTKLPEARVEQTLDRLARAGFVEAAGEFNGAALHRVTATGLAHPQKNTEIRDAEPPHLPVYSDRVQAVLAAIENAGALRIREVRDSLRLPQKSANALMQYLKRKKLVVKVGDWFEDPYVLTALGRITLAEMARPGHLRSGYEKGALDLVASPKGHPRWSSREEEARVLSALRSEQPADLTKVSGAAELAPDQVRAVLDRLVDRALVEAAGELDGRPLYRATSTGASRGQRRRKPPAAPRPRLPVYSDRIQAVLSVIANAGALRIKQVAEALQLPGQSMNALMQYLKKRALVQKRGENFDDPYALTEAGRTALAGMEQRRAA